MTKNAEAKARSREGVIRVSELQVWLLTLFDFGELVDLDEAAVRADASRRPWRRGVRQRPRRWRVYARSALDALQRKGLVDAEGRRASPRMYRVD